MILHIGLFGLGMQQDSHAILKLLKKYWISKSVFKTLEKYWNWPKYVFSIEIKTLNKYWNWPKYVFSIKNVQYGNSIQKMNLKYLSRILLKAKQLIIYAVSCNVQNWVWLI